MLIQLIVFQALVTMYNQNASTMVSNTPIMVYLLQLVGLVTAFFAEAGSLWCLFDRCWKMSSEDLAVQPYSVCYGIWIGCTINTDGSWVCDGYFGKTVIDRQISPRQHYCRAATITAIILFGCAMLLGGYGGQCCRIKSLQLRQKHRFITIAGWFCIVGAILVGSAGSWYLSEIYYERIWYHQAPNAGLGYTIGRGIFLALAASLLGLIAGLCFFFSKSDCCVGDYQEDDSIYDSNFRTAPLPPAKRSHYHSSYRPREYAPKVASEYI